MTTARRKQQRVSKTGTAKPETGNSRATIMRAATRLFAEKTYEQVTIREIALAAQVQNPTIYHFFKSKDGLYREAVMDYYTKKAVGIERLPPPGTPPRVRLQALLYQQLRAFSKDEIFFQLLHRELLSPDYRFKKALAEKILRNIYDYIGDIIAGTAYGSGNKFIPTIIMSMLVGYLQVSRFEKYLPGFAASRDQAKGLLTLAAQISELIIPDSDNRADS